MRQQLKIIQQNPKTPVIILTLFFVFQQIAYLINYFGLVTTLSWAGNLDPFYLIAFYYLMLNRKDKKKLFFVVKISALMFLYMIIQYLLLPNFDVFRGLVMIAKIAFCIMIMLYFKENFHRFKLLVFAKMTTIIFSFMTIMALIFYQNPILWTLNDVVNKYDLTRLKLLYLEPSSLGLHIMIIMFILAGYVFIQTSTSKRIEIFLWMIPNVFILYFVRSLGSIVLGFITLFIMIIIDWFRAPSRIKNNLYIGILCLGLLTILLMILLKSPIILRIVDTFNGVDSSNYYRVNISFIVAYRSLFDFYGLGCGFGNVNTLAFQIIYREIGFYKVLANSFIYFFVETGIFGLIFLLSLIKNLIVSCLRKFSLIKWALLIFLIMYQLVGLYFTNGLIWALYGIILSDFVEKPAPIFSR